MHIAAITVGSVSGTLKPRGRGARPGLKISAMIAATAAAATVGAVLVIGPGGAAAAGRWPWLCTGSE